MKLKNMSLKQEILGIIVVSMLVLGGGCLILTVGSLARSSRQEVATIEKVILDERMAQLRDLMSNAFSVLSTASYYEQAQKALSDMRFGADQQNYFFVVDLDGMIFVNPQRPDMVGKVNKGLKDAAGKPYVLDIIKTAGEKGEGFIRTREVKAGFTEPSERLLYVKHFRKWNWAVVSGIYIDDIDLMTAQKKSEIHASMRTQIYNVVLAVVVALLLSFFAAGRIISKRIVNPIMELTEAVDKMSMGDLDRKISVNSNREIGLLAESIERIQVSLNKAIQRLKYQKPYKGDMEPVKAAKNPVEDESEENELFDLAQ